MNLQEQIAQAWQNRELLKESKGQEAVRAVIVAGIYGQLSLNRAVVAIQFS